MGESVQDGSSATPLALVFLAVMGAMMLCARRQAAVMALLLTAALIPLGPQLVIFGLHFHFIRIVLLVGFCRVLFRREVSGFRMAGMDKLVIGWSLTGVICGILRGPHAETFGLAYNSLGTYFLFRILIEEPDDAVEHLRLLAVLVAVIAGFMCWEAVSHKNPFYVLGGVPQAPMERGDRMRCQGPFRIPILAGTFSAALFPMVVGLWFQGVNKGRAFVGIVGCIVATVLSNSSGPLLCFMASVAGWGLWILRGRMYLFRRSIVAAIIVLSMVMKIPVWWLIAKVSDIVGGGGWHRSYVIDVAVKHFNEWWMIGTSRTADWAPSGEVLLVDPDNMDITNHFVAQGINGGVLMLGLFVASIVFCFKYIGKAVQTEAVESLDPKLIWSMGIALASHCTAFISISYFDQISVFWFWLLAVICTISKSVEVLEEHNLSLERIPQEKEEATLPEGNAPAYFGLGRSIIAQ